MDFEKIIYVIILLALFLFRQYQQFGKKARKEMDDDMPAKPVAPEQSGRPKRSLEELLGELLDEPKPAWQPKPQVPEQPFRPEPTYTEPPPGEAKYVPSKETPVKEAKYVTMQAESAKGVEEVAKAIAHPIKHIDYHPEEEGRSPYANFDLRDAVIKSIILQRPEW